MGGVTDEEPRDDDGRREWTVTTEMRDPWACVMLEQNVVVEFDDGTRSEGSSFHDFSPEAVRELLSRLVPPDLRVGFWAARRTPSAPIASIDQRWHGLVMPRVLPVAAGGCIHSAGLLFRARFHDLPPGHPDRDALLPSAFSGDSDDPPHTLVGASPELSSWPLSDLPGNPADTTLERSGPWLDHGVHCVFMEAWGDLYLMVETSRYAALEQGLKDLCGAWEVELALREGRAWPPT